MNFLPTQNFVNESYSLFENQIVKSISLQQRKVALIALAVFSLLVTCVAIYRHCFHAKIQSSKKEPLIGKEKLDDSDHKLSSKEKESVLTTVFFVTCNPGPAGHFAALGKALDTKYDVSFIAAGASLAKIKDQQVKVTDFNPEQLDLSKDEVQIQLANKVAKICAVANIVIVDVGHKFYVHLEKALAKSGDDNDQSSLLASYYDNIERWVPGGYSKTAEEVMKISQAVFLANFKLAEEDLYSDEKSVIDLKDISRMGIGYFPLEQAEKLRQDRLTKRQEARQKFLESLGYKEKGQEILVYLGENNSEYFEQSLPKFLEFIEEISKRTDTIDLTNTLIVFQQHPNAKAKQEEQRLLNEKNLDKKPNYPTCIISNVSSSEALVVADVVAGRQSSMVYQIALAKIPYMQVGHKTYPDVLVRNGLCPSVTTAEGFAETLEQLIEQSPKDDPEADKKILDGLGIQSNWAENFDNGIQMLLKSKALKSGKSEK